MTWPTWTGTLRGMHLSLLPAEEREILFCASTLSWPVERIARHFGLPSDVVKLRLHDALHRLKGRLPISPPGTP